MPVFDIDPRTFPMPTLQQGSPLGGVLSDAIAKRLAMAKAQEAEAEVPYAGLSKIADILSKNAYANAVTPQFQAKLLGVPGAIANLKTPQTTLNKLEDYGQTGSTGSPLQDYINQELIKIAQKNNQAIPGDNLLGRIGKGIKNIFTGGQEQPSEPVQTTVAPSYNAAVPAQVQGQEVAPTTPTPLTQIPRGRSTESQAYSKNQAKYNEEVSKGTALGTETGKQQAAYGPQAQAIVDQQKATKYLTKVFNNPVIKEISDVPFASQNSIAWYKQSGTEAQKTALGEYTRAMNDYVSSSLKMFGSRATDLDVKFLKDDLKPSDKDTMAVRKGKLIGAQTYINSKAQQVQLADQYMSQNMTQTQAEFKAAKDIDLDAIRKQAYDDIYEKNKQFNPKHITVKNIQDAATKLKKTVPEIISMMEAKGIKIGKDIPYE